MSELLLAIDPGEVTGWSTWQLEDDAPLTRLDYGLVKGGALGWRSWMSAKMRMRPGLIVCERFNPNDGRAGKANYVDHLRIEGGLLVAADALGLPDPIWHHNDMKALCSDATLKSHGLWLTGRDERIGWQDARDVNDSQRHALAWAKAAGHEPTLLRYWPPAPVEGQ